MSGRLSFEVIERADLGRARDAYRAMHERRLCGLVVKQAIDPELLRAAAERSIAMRVPNELRHAPVVSRLDVASIEVLGRTMRLSPAGDYFEHVEPTRRLMASIFDLERGLEEHVAALLGAVGAGYQVTAPSSEGRAFSPALISRVAPGAEIPFHFDNFVFHEPTGMEHIKPLLDQTTLLNLQVPLQRPIEGGDLVVAEYSWEELAAQGPIAPDAHVDTPARAAADHVTVPLEVGDFLLFDAGRNCHRITPVVGERDRLTYVAHTALSADRTSIVYFV